MSLLFSTGVIAASGLGGAAPGMVLLTPTSITHSGTSASIGANGQVTFTAVTSLSLNGVFSADFDNYAISIRHLMNTSQIGIQARYRASGSDASGSNYTQQGLFADGSSVTAGRDTSQTSVRIGYASSAQRSGDMAFIYGPFLAQPTASRHVNVNGYLNGTIFEYAGTHSLSTSYDGITLFLTSNSISGAVAVYGVRS